MRTTFIRVALQADAAPKFPPECVGCGSSDHVTPLRFHRIGPYPSALQDLAIEAAIGIASSILFWLSWILGVLGTTAVVAWILLASFNDAARHGLQVPMCTICRQRELRSRKFDRILVASVVAAFAAGIGLALSSRSPLTNEWILISVGMLTVGAVVTRAWHEATAPTGFRISEADRCLAFLFTAPEIAAKFQVVNEDVITAG